MTQEIPQILLQQSARETLKRIATDQAGAPAVLAKILADLRFSLFEPTLSVTVLLDRCQILAHSIQEQFRKVFGTTIGSYLLDRRLETASALLRETSIPVSQVGRLVGYTHPGNFSRVFRRWAGETPTAFRKERRLSPLEPKDAPISHRTLRRVLLEQASPKENKRLCSHLATLYPQQVQRYLETTLEKNLAQNVWTAIEAQSFRAQQQIVSCQLGFSTPALFHFLQKLITRLGRYDRKKGVEVAELALDSLHSCEDSLGAEIADYHTRAWAEIAIARRLAFDVPGAAEALERAQLAWETPRAITDPFAATVLCRAKADFHRFHRRFPAASRKAEKSLAYVEAVSAAEGTDPSTEGNDFCSTPGWGRSYANF